MNAALNPQNHNTPKVIATRMAIDQAALQDIFGEGTWKEWIERIKKAEHALNGQKRNADTNAYFNGKIQDAFLRRSGLGQRYWGYILV